MYIGIDPGKTGALAVVNEKGLFVCVIDYEPHEVLEWLYENLNNINYGYLESVHSMPRQGVVSTFNFGENFGWWKGVLLSLEIKHELVPPRVWMKKYFLKKESAYDKPGLELARKMFPEAPLSLKKHHNRADALLLAYQCWEEHNGVFS